MRDALIKCCINPIFALLWYIWQSSGATYQSQQNSHKHYSPRNNYDIDASTQQCPPTMLSGNSLLVLWLVQPDLHTKCPDGEDRRKGHEIGPRTRPHFSLCNMAQTITSHLGVNFFNNSISTCSHGLPMTLSLLKESTHRWFV